MFSRLMSSPYTPRKPPPSMKKEKLFPNGSSGGEGGVGGGAGCWARASPAVRIMAARRLKQYLAFIQNFLRKSLRLTRSARPEVPKMFCCRLRLELRRSREARCSLGPQASRLPGYVLSRLRCLAGETPAVPGKTTSQKQARANRIINLRRAVGPNGIAGK